ncbi:hypothetical protein [Lysinibacillus sp. BW-2-10]|uniref:hypothetical protein n=1 Tax=Lysinibacillus sp. BW-2-10 TaxID=2590030 RepID=UPI001180BBD0|nr:hypothetical protein [Lysinibacillus sp. BW-2-10]TSI07662.1 hypothetical protein FJQ64_08185 [Lysinibacillus sp. BW-2-10]
MIDNVIEVYKKYRKKLLRKGYEVVGIPITISFFVILFSTMVSFFLIFELSKWFFLLEIILVSMLLKINKKVDNLLKISWLNYEDKLKDYIAYYLKDKGVILSEQFRDLSIILKEKSEKKYKKYDLNPYLAMVVAIIIFALSLLTNDSLKPLIVTIAFSSIFIIISINPIVNIYTNIFINRDSEIIYELASIVDELYFEVSIKEAEL